MMTIEEMLRLQRRCVRRSNTAGLRVSYRLWCHEPGDSQFQDPVWTLEGTLSGTDEKIALRGAEDFAVFKQWVADRCQPMVGGIERPTDDNAIARWEAENSTGNCSGVQR